MADAPPAVPELPQVLPNKLGITDYDQLARAERAFSDLRTFELRLQPVAGRFDFAHYKQIHARLLGDVYDWAGHNRDYQTQRGFSVFARPDFIESEGTRIFTRLAKDNFLRGLDANTFADKAAKLGADLNALHPAIDGNGRTTRLFLEQLGTQAGHPLDFSRFAREDLYTHFEKSFHEGGEALRPLVVRAMDAGRAMAQQLAVAAAERGFLEPVVEAGRPLSAAAAAYLSEPESDAVAKHPELATAFASERRMRTAAAELGALAPAVEQAVSVRIREHVSVYVHRGVDAAPTEGILNAVRHDAATTQLDHAVRLVQEARDLDPQSSVGFRSGQGISLEQRDWLIRSAEDALRPTASTSPMATVPPSRQGEARWIASAIGLVDFPARHRSFQDPALHALYEEQQRERGAGLDQSVREPQILTFQRQRDLNP